MNDRLLSILCFALLLFACTTGASKELTASERGSLSTLLVNLSSAVDSYFSTLPAAPTENDADILAKATSPDPSLLAPAFNDYQLKTQYQGHYAVLLLCSKDGSVAYMEDAGCSARLDRQVTQTAPCEFTLKVSPNCQVEGGDPQ